MHSLLLLVCWKLERAETAEIHMMARSEPILAMAKMFVGFESLLLKCAVTMTMRARVEVGFELSFDDEVVVLGKVAEVCEREV